MILLCLARVEMTGKYISLLLSHPPPTHSSSSSSQLLDLSARPTHDPSPRHGDPQRSHRATVSFGLRRRSPSHSDHRPAATSASHGRDRSTTWTASFEAAASCLSGFRKPHVISSGDSTPPPFSTAGRAAPCRCRAGRLQNGFRSSLRHWTSRRCRPCTRMALTHWLAPAGPGVALVFHAWVSCQDCPGHLCLPGSR